MRRALALNFLFVLGSCGGDAAPGLDLTGTSPEEAGAKVAAALCAHFARCGNPVIQCTGGGSSTGGESTTCEGSIRKVDLAACQQDAAPDVTELFTCAMPTDEQKALYASCIDEWVAQPCATQDQVDAVARQVEMGVEPVRPWDRPARCDEVEQAVFGMCLPPTRN